MIPLTVLLLVVIATARGFVGANSYDSTVMKAFKIAILVCVLYWVYYYFTHDR